MAQPKLQLQFAHSAVLRYGLAGASFGVALGLALLAQRYGFRNVEVPLFLFAVALTAWYAGPGPAALAVVFSIITRDGEQALDYLYCRGEYKMRSTDNPAVMLLDLKLPKVDGLEVLQQIKSD